MDKAWVWLPRNSIEYEQGATKFVFDSARCLGNVSDMFCPCLDWLMHSDVVEGISQVVDGSTPGTDRIQIINQSDCFYNAGYTSYWSYYCVLSLGSFAGSS